MGCAGGTKPTDSKPVTTSASPHYLGIDPDASLDDVDAVSVTTWGGVQGGVALPAGRGRVGTPASPGP